MPRLLLGRHLTLAEELLASVNTRHERYWNGKILGGLVPTETVLKGNVDLEAHHRELDRLVNFELLQVDRVLNTMGNLRGGQIHYFGIGNALALKKVARLANSRGADVRAYDLSKVACVKAQEVFDELELTSSLSSSNLVYQADMTFACQEKFIDAAYSRLIIAPRIIDVLKPTKGEFGTQEYVQGKERKVKKTARRLGRLLEFLKVLLIHPCPEGNENAVFRDTTLYPLSLITTPMEQGLGAAVRTHILGTVEFHRHVYTAALLEKS